MRDSEEEIIVEDIVGALYDDPNCKDFADIHIQSFGRCILDILDGMGLEVIPRNDIVYIIEDDYDTYHHGSKRNMMERFEQMSDIGDGWDGTLKLTAQYIVDDLAVKKS